MYVCLFLKFCCRARNNKKVGVYGGIHVKILYEFGNARPNVIYQNTPFPSYGTLKWKSPFAFCTLSHTLNRNWNLFDQTSSPKKIFPESMTSDSYFTILPKFSLLLVWIRSWCIAPSICRYSLPNIWGRNLP